MANAKNVTTRPTSGLFCKRQTFALCTKTPQKWRSAHIFFATWRCIRCRFRLILARFWLMFPDFSCSLGDVAAPPRRPEAAPEGSGCMDGWVVVAPQKNGVSGPYRPYLCTFGTFLETRFYFYFFMIFRPSDLPSQPPKPLPQPALEKIEIHFF